jgi:hypothetical protein
MSLFQLQIPKSYADGRPYIAAYVDEQKNAVEQWAQQMVNNFSQLASDLFGTNYVYNATGVASRVTAVVDAFAELTENETILGAWTFSSATAFSNDVTIKNGNDFEVFSDNGVTSKFNVAGATGNTTVGGTLGVTGNTTLTGTTTFIGAITGENVKIYSGYDLECYSDAGTTLKAKIDTSTGELLLADVDPPQSNYLNRNSAVKASLYYRPGIGISESYNIDSVTEEGTNESYIIYIDTDLPSTAIVTASPVESVKVPAAANAVLTINCQPSSTDFVALQMFDCTETPSVTVNFSDDFNLIVV